MSRPVVNLARRAFVNSRPASRATALLFALGFLALAADVWLYRSYFVGSSERARRLAEIEESIADESRRIAELEVELAGLALARQNEAVRFLNHKIAERAFTWSRLFDRLADVLPDDVRLLRLNPEAGEDGRRSGGRGKDGAEVAIELSILGEAKGDEALLALVDGLFDHPNFRRPNPRRENRLEGGQALQFDLTVAYLPGEAEAPAAEEEAPVEEPGTEEPGGEDPGDAEPPDEEPGGEEEGAAPGADDGPGGTPGNGGGGG